MHYLTVKRKESKHVHAVVNTAVNALDKYILC